MIKRVIICHRGKDKIRVKSVSQNRVATKKQTKKIFVAAFWVLFFGHDLSFLKRGGEREREREREQKGGWQTESVLAT